jgi:hypothetical protein
MSPIPQSSRSVVRIPGQSGPPILPMVRTTVRTRMAVKCVPYQHDMACHQNAGGGGDIYMWRVATNKLYQKSQAADKGWSSSLVLSCGE